MGRRGVFDVPSPDPGPVQPASRQNELDMLKEQAETLVQQLRQIQDRIRELEKENENA
jgi:hypothetical protein